MSARACCFAACEVFFFVAIGLAAEHLRSFGPRNDAPLVAVLVCVVSLIRPPACQCLAQNVSPPPRSERLPVALLYVRLGGVVVVSEVYQHKRQKCVRRVVPLSDRCASPNTCYFALASAAGVWPLSLSLCPSAQYALQSARASCLATLDKLSRACCSRAFARRGLVCCGCSL